MNFLFWPKIRYAGSRIKFEEEIHKWIRQLTCKEDIALARRSHIALVVMLS